MRHEQPEADTISTDDVANDKTNTVAKTIPAPDETAKLYTALQDVGALNGNGEGV